MPTIPADHHAGPAWLRRRLLLALPAACSLAWPAAATPGSAPPNAAVRRTQARLETLEALVQSANLAQQDAEALQRALQALQASGRAAQDAEAPARSALQAWRDQALPALAPPHAQWRAATAAVQAAAGAHQAAARNLLSAAPADRAAAMDRLDSAADQRRIAERTELAARRTLDTALATGAAAFDQLAARWLALAGPTAASGDGLRASAQDWAALQRRWQALGQSARTAGLAGLRLPSLAPAAPWAVPGTWAPPAAPTAAALQAWRSADRRALQALQALWLQSDALAAVQQALADADCSGTACAGWRADAEALVADGARAQSALAAAQADQSGAAGTLAAQPAAAGQQLQAVLARRDSLGTALAQAGGAALRSLRAAAAVGQAALAPLAAAREQAQAAWFAALQAQYGDAWMDALGEPAAGSSMGQAQAAPAPTGASRLDLVLASHALHRLRARGDEPGGFGAYTYVLVGASVRPDTPGVHARLQRLLGEVHNLPVADQLDSGLRARANTFVVPVPADSRDDGDLVVHLPLAQSLLTHLPPALRLADATRRQLYAENGPFLITLPGRLAEARADWPLLFADLSKTPEVVVADVVRRYMADLIGSFNPASADWAPPAGMRVAITLVRLVRGSGDVVQAVFGAPRR